MAFSRYLYMAELQERKSVLQERLNFIPYGHRDAIVTRAVIEILNELIDSQRY